MAAVVSNARRWTIVGLLFAASLINYLDRATLALAKIGHKRTDLRIGKCGMVLDFSHPTRGREGLL